MFRKLVSTIKSSPFRQLTQDEIEWLQRQMGVILFIRKVIIFLGIVIFVSSYFLLQTNNISFLKSPSLLNTLIMMGEIFVILLLLLNNKMEYDRNKHDSKQPVYKITGKVSKQRHFGPNDDRTLKIDEMKFNFTYLYNNSELPAFYDLAKEGAQVTAEYSPETKHIWKIYSS